MTAAEMAEHIRELDGGQEILTKKIERLERVLRAVIKAAPIAFAKAQTILDETFPI